VNKAHIGGFPGQHAMRHSDHGCDVRTSLERLLGGVFAPILFVKVAFVAGCENGNNSFEA
jgi:hypothetical protein